MRIVCQQTILMKYHALFVILKKRQNLKLLLQIVGDALWVKAKLLNLLLVLCMQGNFEYNAFRHLQILYKISFSKIFQEYHQSVKLFRSRSATACCLAWTGLKLFAKFISRLHKFPRLSGKELILVVCIEIKKHYMFFN